MTTKYTVKCISYGTKLDGKFGICAESVEYQSDTLECVYDFLKSKVKCLNDNGISVLLVDMKPKYTNLKNSVTHQQQVFKFWRHQQTHYFMVVLNK